MRRSQDNPPTQQIETGLRGVSTMDQAADWLAERGIEDIECITPDIAGVARGKMMPSSKTATRSDIVSASVWSWVT